ncbi:MAG TPA: NUDIX domain-containing protein [Solirubrobacteraceae bacterium]|nr:NUDIX domain-containing protein [Solirubrobacteraceae bacterium]
MPRRSAGLLLFRRPGPEVLLVHPGGPFWARKDRAAWSIPKGEIEPGEEPPDVARREFSEELGLPVPPGELSDLGEVRQAGGKVVRAYALEGDLDAGAISSNSFEMEWPPRSGRRAAFPEVDRAAWFDLATAREKLVPGQVPLLERL